MSPPNKVASIRKRESGPAGKTLRGAIRGILVSLSEAGEPMIDFHRNPTSSPIRAASTVPLSPSDVGSEAMLMFEDADPSRPILIGLLQPLRPAARPNQDPNVTLSVDGRKLTIAAEQEITLSCGEASITLTKAGKITIRGTYVLSRASGPNRVQGASVHLN